MTKATPTTAAVAAALNALHDALLEEYVGDFAFTVFAEGNLIAASSMYNGIVMPRVKAEPPVDDVPMNQPDLRC